MNEQEMKQRTKQFALRAIEVARHASGDFVGRRLGDQLLRSGTSVAANYRSACRARSKADFISKIGIAEEEADESMLWLELLMETGIAAHENAGALLKEANELTAILTASRKTARGE